MNFPEFGSDFLITVEKPYPKVYVEELLIKKLPESDLTVEVTELDRERSYTNGEWISSSSFINLYIGESFFENHYKTNSKHIEPFLDSFKEMIKPVTEISGVIKSSDEIKRTRPFASFSVFYLTKDKYVFHYLFEFEGNENDYIAALRKVFESIALYNAEEPNKFQTAVKESYVQSNGIKYMLFLDSKWTVLNPLFEVGREINERYRKDKDFRIMKPHVMMHRDDYRKYFVLDSNWVLVFDGLETLMIKPNDVSLYSNISDKNLQAAQEFYNETILPRFKLYYGSFPPIEQQNEYYNYFELIITALIFAYTALEAFANICIPNNYEYLIEKSGVKTIYSKEAIERKFSLRDKFKNILRSIINTPDVTKEKWWNSFDKLEKLRDETIHTKQSKSEDRYSQLLSKDIFKLISIHKEIISYYGNYISKNKKDLLEEFPYNFGYDDFFPGLMTDEGYEQTYRTLRNLPEKKKEREN